MHVSAGKTVISLRSMVIADASGNPVKKYSLTPFGQDEESLPDWSGDGWTISTTFTGGKPGIWPVVAVPTISGQKVISGSFAVNADTNPANDITGNVIKTPVEEPTWSGKPMSADWPTFRGKCKTPVPWVHLPPNFRSNSNGRLKGSSISSQDVIGRPLWQMAACSSVLSFSMRWTAIREQSSGSSNFLQIGAWPQVPQYRAIERLPDPKMASSMLLTQELEGNCGSFRLMESEWVPKLWQTGMSSPCQMKEYMPWM